MNFWEKVRISANLAASILIPVVLVVVTNIYSSAEKARDINARYIELAIGILRDEPNSNSSQIRNWAVNVINRYSEVKLTPDVRKQLIENRILAIPEDAAEFQEQSGMAADGIAGPATRHKLDKDVEVLLSQDKKIEAIKLVRNVTGIGLKEAKDYVEAHQKEGSE